MSRGALSLSAAGSVQHGSLGTAAAPGAPGVGFCSSDVGGALLCLFPFASVQGADLPRQREDLLLGQGVNSWDSLGKSAVGAVPLGDCPQLGVPSWAFSGCLVEHSRSSEHPSSLGTCFNMLLPFLQGG